MPKPPEKGTPEFYKQAREMESAASDCVGLAHDLKAKLQEMYSTNPGLISDEILQTMDEVLEECQSNLFTGIPYFYSE